MIKVEVIEKFTLKDFDELKNIERKSTGTIGTLFVGDRFECSESMAKYLTGDNPLKKAVVKVVEVEPIVKKLEVPEIKLEIVDEEENKPLKKNKKKKK